MELGLSRREFLVEVPKIGLKLLLLPSALTGLASLVFADEDYLAKLPPLNGRKVTEELIQEMLNVGSVKGILEKYGNKDNIFYVEFTPDGRNNLDDLVRKEPDKWDGSYVLVANKERPCLRQAIVMNLLSQQQRKVRFIFYNLEKDGKANLKNGRYELHKDNSLLLILNEFDTTETDDRAMAKPAKIGERSQPKIG